MLNSHEPADAIVPPGGTYPSSQITAPDGTIVEWAGFYTGPTVLSARDLAGLAHSLVGPTISDGLVINTEALGRLSAELLKPFVLDQERAFPPSVIIHGATSTTGGFEGDVSELVSGGHAYDCATYLETRATFLAAPGDLVLGRTAPWREAAAYLDFGGRRIKAFDVGFLDYYYLSQALLVAAQAFQAGTTISFFEELLAWLEDNPSTLIRSYSLDLEMQIFLCWLARRVNTKGFAVDCNTAEVATRWNQKGPLFPLVNWAATLPLPQRDDSRSWHDQEKRGSEIVRLLGIELPTLPGYRISNASQDKDLFFKQLVAAAELLRSRHGIMRLCLKPSNAGDGARITPDIDGHNTEALDKLAAIACGYDDDYLVEPHVTYRQLNMAGHSFKLALSAHIRYGRVLPTLTLQIMAGKVWTGNILVPRHYAEDIGISVEMFNEILTIMERLAAALDGRLVTGGVDFAIGSTDATDPGTAVLALQDPNLSSHGAEFLRAYCDRHVDRIRDGLIAGTRVLNPTDPCTIGRLDEALRDLSKATGIHVGAIASVPGRWAMIACLASSPVAVIESLCRCEAWMKQHGLLQDTATWPAEG